MKVNHSLKFFAAMVLVMLPLLGVSLWADALATPPQHIRTWEFTNTAGTTLGQLTTTAKNVTLTQTFTTQPGKLPTQSIQIIYDAVAGAPDAFFTATLNATSNVSSTTTGNGVNIIRIVAGDQPVSIDGRFNYFSVIRGTNGTNTDQNLRLKAVY